MAPIYRWDAPTSAYIDLATGASVEPSPGFGAWDWSDTNLPWQQGAGSHPWSASLPPGVPVVPLNTAAGGDFYNQLTKTCDAAAGRVIVELPAGVHSYTSFRKLGSGSDPTYAFGFYHQKLAGLYSAAGVEGCIVEMAANSVSEEQLARMATIQQAAFAPLQMGLIRIDTQYQSAPAPVYLGGLTFEAAPQNPLTALAPDVTGDIFLPQSAPHQGVIIYSDQSRRHPDTIVTHTRFRGAGKAMNSQPPFEMANLGSQRNHITYKFCEFDGRMSPRYDPTRPRKCGPIMLNGGVFQDIQDSWLHGSNISRYAANDESVLSTTALSVTYRAERVKIEQITNNQNRQPPLNGGNSLGGYTNASCFGWESSNGLIEIIDCIVSVDNDQTSGQIPTHFQLTNTGAARAGGRMVVRNVDARHTKFPQLDGFITYRIGQSTNWWSDGFNTTLDVRAPDNTRLAPHVVTGAWPPTAMSLAGAGVTPNTHYLIRST